MNYNKIVSVNDYAELIGHKPPIKRKEWEIAMALKTLRDHGVVHGNAEILGAGAGHEATIYHLSNEVKRIFATDRYLNPGEWQKQAAAVMLSNPGNMAQDVWDNDIPHDPQRIVTQHMDMKRLLYADESFDGVFSSGSIEHVGTLDDVATAAAELGRVLKPGGVLSISTEFKISGDGNGFHNVLLLDFNDIMKYIVQPSGCEMVDDLVPEVDDDTLASAWELDEIVQHDKRPDVEAVLRHGHYLFTSVHLALKKPEKRAYTRSSKRKSRKSDDE